jgi:hypothetical protein
LEDFNLKNQARRDSDLPPMTAEAYLKLVK